MRSFPGRALPVHPRPADWFSFGTGMKHAAALFSECIEACRLGGWNGILLTPGTSCPRPCRPSDALRLAAFERLFPRCRAVVHHGGIGTTAKALHAGIGAGHPAVCV